ncbi:hypothetical protein SBF1_1490006 [Candidatus Desulfosporosinus infrequens]|uniref:Uncharacterized protein n=1 Tax=Candidatus Desulfosporosinus infrequens TaxID=2043169 RepID=A0A2U3K6S5_9FIRM|nr:hypothetical protein SBF1_1490006 [Candidatus Desulfosporosinus infrequens]
MQAGTVLDCILPPFSVCVQILHNLDSREKLYLQIELRIIIFVTVQVLS